MSLAPGELGFFPHTLQQIARLNPNLDGRGPKSERVKVGEKVGSARSEAKPFLGLTERRKDRLVERVLLRVPCKLELCVLGGGGLIGRHS